MLLMARRGQGIAFAPQSFAQLGLQGLAALVPVADAEFRTHLNMIWPRQQALSPIASRVRELIMRRFGPGGGDKRAAS
ncbi:LysR substrate-binding domain protein [Bordetella bronchiseptica MBORD665]|nr:LysR substrate-binding domain protein [Bordetella bronchiseptica MBORD668]KDC88377.1 LysR substrate-binding domain protein [Bordetella bronchiseptica MBORD665]